MSRTIARTLRRMVGLVTAPMSPRGRDKTVSRLIGELDRRSARIVETPYGNLVFLALRGPYVASAVNNFTTDEPETLAWIDTRLKPGETLWDIGACFGIYALYAALRPDVRVMAFEAKAVNFALLVEHVMLNRMDGRVIPVCVALAGETRLTGLQIASPLVGGAGNTLAGEEGQFGAIDAAFTQAVPAFAADDFCRTFRLPPPDHIKLDVDGIEGLILEGARETLPAVKSVLIEVEGKNAAQAAERIDKPLSAAGFVEDLAFREQGSRRNRLFFNASRA